MAPETLTLQHPSIGSIKGIRRSSQVEQYLGIQYATLTDRFARGQLIETYASPLDATSHGSVLTFPLAASDPYLILTPL
jgi:carboxylesterase type B